MPDQSERIEAALEEIEHLLGLSDADAERIGYAKGQIVLPVDIAERLIGRASERGASV